eukprot:CAMPEP_0118651154 /NCGR_PEP_ID=MMETSP0785-20121206/10636_1 /TAXON_ID=91992 /ORGANISM="Bolidomonas pacifica, Strain CCMP 1866" /LENGTH=493 /DNA_ID=CAMNT_0006543591 /DNA_START=723 /DNA_END=2201 /DNA_ORIENTATION=-
MDPSNPEAAFSRNILTYAPQPSSYDYDAAGAGYSQPPPISNVYQPAHTIPVGTPSYGIGNSHNNNSLSSMFDYNSIYGPGIASGFNPMAGLQGMSMFSSLPHVPNQTVPEFLFQLTKMLTDDNKDIIEWVDGEIAVHQPTKLASSVLHRYFRHSKYASFQRQLNYFGFRKIAGKGKMSPCRYVNADVTKELSSLLKIKRKTNGASTGKRGAAARAAADESYSSHTKQVRIGRHGSTRSSTKMKKIAEDRAKRAGVEDVYGVGVGPGLAGEPTNAPSTSAADIPQTYSRPLSEQIRKLDVPPASATSSVSGSSNSISSFEQAKSVVGKGVKHGFNNFGKSLPVRETTDVAPISTSINPSPTAPVPAPLVGENQTQCSVPDVAKSSSSSLSTSDFQTYQDKQNYEELEKNFQKSVEDMSKAQEVYNQMASSFASQSSTAQAPVYHTNVNVNATAGNAVLQENFHEQMQKSYAAFVSQYPSNASQYASFMDPIVMQ